MRVYHVIMEPRALMLISILSFVCVEMGSSELPVATVYIFEI